jgi:hypothetical protein
MKKKTLALAMMVGMALVVIGGCSKGADADSSTTGGTTGAAATAGTTGAATTTG